MHHGNTDKTANCNLPMLNTQFQAVGFDKGTQNGIGAHHHFIGDWRLGVGRVAARRIPCYCVACRQQLRQPWVDTIDDPLEQPRFQTPEECLKKDIMGIFNDWKTLSFKAKSGVEKEETEQVFDWVLDSYEMKVASVIEVDKFGAHLADDDHHAIRWTSEAMALQPDSKQLKAWVETLLKQALLLLKQCTGIRLAEPNVGMLLRQLHRLKNSLFGFGM